MKRFLARWIPVSLVIALVTGFGPARPASVRPAAAADASLLPARLRPRGEAILGQRDDAKRAKLASSLAEEEPERAARFLIAVADADPSAEVRREILDELGTHRGELIRESLKRHAKSDPDLDVSLTALERLREQDAQGLHQILRSRLAAARARNDADAVQRLLLEDEKWITIELGSNLPGFLRRPPAPFSVVPADRAIHVLAFGDFGNGSAEQKQTAVAMQSAHRDHPFDFGITLGDNFYEEGMTSPSDERWRSQWEDLYGPLGIRFYPAFGNHDWGLPDSPAAEILYSAKSSSWTMPAPYYTFTAGPAQFFAIDTDEVSELQLTWLEEQLERSAAAWKIVYGHHPIYSAGHHGDTPELVERLLPVLRNRANVYLCGHDHDLQHLREEGGVHFFVAGGGGAYTRALHADPRSIFGMDAHGFAILEADASALTVRLVGADSKELHAATIRKGATN